MKEMVCGIRKEQVLTGLVIAENIYCAVRPALPYKLRKELDVPSNTVRALISLLENVR